MEQSFNLNIFSNNLAILRNEKKLSKTQIASQLGIHRETYAAYECGISCPSFKATEAIASFFMVDINALTKKDAHAIIAEQQFYNSLEDRQKALIHSYRNLSLISRGRLMEYAKALYLKENGIQF